MGHLRTHGICVLRASRGARCAGSLAPPQVVNKDADEVQAEVEALAYNLAEQILSGEGFAFDIPSRAKGNQVRADDALALTLTLCSRATEEREAPKRGSSGKFRVPHRAAQGSHTRHAAQGGASSCAWLR